MTAEGVRRLEVLRLPQATARPGAFPLVLRSGPRQREQRRRSLRSGGWWLCGGRGGRACGAGSGGQDSSSVGGGLCCHSGVASEESVKGVLLSKGELGGQDLCRQKLPAGPETPGRRAVGSPPSDARVSRPPSAGGAVELVSTLPI